MTKESDLVEAENTREGGILDLIKIENENGRSSSAEAGSSSEFIEETKTRTDLKHDAQVTSKQVVVTEVEIEDSTSNSEVEALSDELVSDPQGNLEIKDQDAGCTEFQSELMQDRDANPNDITSNLAKVTVEPKLDTNMKPLEVTALTLKEQHPQLVEAENACEGGILDLIETEGENGLSSAEEAELLSESIEEAKTPTDLKQEGRVTSEQFVGTEVKIDDSSSNPDID